MVESSRRISLKLLLILSMFQYIFGERRLFYRMDQRLLILFSIFLMLNIMDTVTTYIGLTNGKATEINPFHKSLNTKGIRPQFVLVKNVVVPLIFCVFFYACLKVVTGYYRTPYYAILIGLIIYYLAVVINNVNVIYKP